MGIFFNTPDPNDPNSGSALGLVSNQDRARAASNMLLGLGVGLLGQKPSTTPQGVGPALAQGLQYGTQLTNQQMANQRANQQLALSLQTGQRQNKLADLSIQEGTQKLTQAKIQQDALAQAVTGLPTDQQAAARADPDAFWKAYNTQMFQKMPTDYLDYQQAQKQGFQGSFLDYKTKIAQAGANQSTINMPPQESAWQSAYGGGQGKAANDLVSTTVPQAQATVNNLGALNNAVGALQAAGGDVGKLAPLKQKAGELLQAFNIDPSSVGLPKDAGPAETITAITNQLALGARNTSNGTGMPGSMSDSDRSFLQSSVPNIEDTPTGLAMKVDVAKRVAQRQIQAGQKWATYPHTEAGWDKFQQDWSNYNQKNPIFGQADVTKAASLAKIATQPNTQVPTVQGSQGTKSPMIVKTLPQGFGF